MKCMKKGKQSSEEWIHWFEVSKLVPAAGQLNCCGDDQPTAGGPDITFRDQIQICDQLFGQYSITVLCSGPTGKKEKVCADLRSYLSIPRPEYSE